MADRMNQTIKVTLAKWVQETGTTWMDRLPLVLVRIRMTLWVAWVFPHEIMFGRPPPLIGEVKRNLLQRGRREVSWQLEHSHMYSSTKDLK